MGCGTRTRIAFLIAVAVGCGESSGKEGVVRYREDASGDAQRNLEPDATRDAMNGQDAANGFGVAHGCRFMEPQEVGTKRAYLTSAADGLAVDQAVTIEAVEVGEMLGRVGTRWRYSFADLINEEAWVSIDAQCQRWLLSGDGWVLSRPNVEPEIGQVDVNGDGEPQFSWATEGTNDANATTDCRRLVGMQPLGLLNVSEELLCSGTGAVEIVAASGNLSGTLTLVTN